MLDSARWQERAACRGPISKVFFPPAAPEARSARDAREARAKAVCRTCSVRQPCLDYALAIRERHGVWGGTSEAERGRLFDLRDPVTAG
ncbi:MAG: WhiB family transcriptional regulator [Actinomycetes bacterium]|jgi:WhiB family redox-sensing transcriptional regulator